MNNMTAFIFNFFTRWSTFWSRKECEGGNHVKAYACRRDIRPLFRDFGSLFRLWATFPPFWSKLPKRIMPSRDNLLHTLFWTKNWTPNGKLKDAKLTDITS